MKSGSQAEFLNSALRVSSNPVELTRLLTDHWLRQEPDDQAMFVLALIGQIAAIEAAKQRAA